MVTANKAPQPTHAIKALAVQMASHRSDLDTDARLHLAQRIAFQWASYGRPRGETIADLRPAHRKK